MVVSRFSSHERFLQMVAGRSGTRIRQEILLRSAEGLVRKRLHNDSAPVSDELTGAESCGDQL